MARSLRSLLQSVGEGLQKVLGTHTSEPGPAAQALLVQQAVASLLYETARADHAVKQEDLDAASDCLRELFALTAEQAAALLAHAGHARHRPTSYHPLVSVINQNLGADEKRRLVEYMWRVAHADREIDMYEDHLVRKIADLIYVPHRDFISAKHRARGAAHPVKPDTTGPDQ
jgi:uncharacterized tellurite resistance protein B-like protein